MDLFYVFRRAWEITRRHKALWLFGFLVSLGTVSTRFGSGSTRWEQLSRELPPEVQPIVSDFLASPYLPILVVFFALLGLAIGVGLALLGTLGRVALVDQTRAAEDRGAVSLRDGWQAGRRHLWPVFFIRLLLGLPAGVVTLVGALPMLGTALLVAGQDRPEVVIPGIVAVEFALFACFVPAVCLAVLLSLPFSLLQRLAVRACVLQEYDVRQSITRAWTMLRAHLASLDVIWLILLGVGIGVMVVVILPMVLVAMTLVTAALLTVLVSPLLFTVLTLLIGVLAWLVGAAVYSVVETFSSAVWTLAYRDLTGLGLTGEVKVESK
ncbi:MAG: hypothetical protein GY832_18500 [Chloroflexi bacterium]|nr:hypothetical protein [Chloroflexota bacterium]